MSHTVNVEYVQGYLGIFQTKKKKKQKKTTKTYLSMIALRHELVITNYLHFTATKSIQIESSNVHLSKLCTAWSNNYWDFIHLLIHV